MPDYGAQAFGVRRNALRIHGWNNHAAFRDLVRESAVAAHDAEHMSARRYGCFEGLDDVYRYVLFHAAAAYGKHQNGVFGVDPRAFQPARKTALPAVVIGARREFRHVVGGGISLKATELAKIVYRVAGMASRTSHTQDEEASAALAHLSQTPGHMLNLAGIQLFEDGDGFGQKRGRETAYRDLCGRRATFRANALQ